MSDNAPYRKPPAARSPRATRQLLKAVWYALVGTLLLVGLCLRLIDANESPRPHPDAFVPFLVSLLLSIVMVVAAMLCRQAIYNRGRPDRRAPVKPQRYLVGSVIGMALCEAPVMVALLLGFLFDAQAMFGLAGAIGLIGLMLMYPSGAPMAPGRDHADEPDPSRG